MTLCICLHWAVRSHLTKVHHERMMQYAVFVKLVARLIFMYLQAGTFHQLTDKSSNIS